MQHKSIDLPLMEIVRLVASGRMALPQFQREFVWDPNKVVDLLDSISHGWPIGSLLLLEGPQAFETKDFQDGPRTSRETAGYYVLDGQQRITSVFHALTDRSDVVYLVDLAGSSDGLSPAFRWAKRDRYRPDTSGYVFPLTSVVQDRRFRSLIADQPSRKVSELRKARESILGFLIEGRYSASATLMGKDIELEALARIFETINRTGVRLDAFDLMVSVLYPKGFHLRDHWDRAMGDFPELELMNTGGLEVLKLIALWRRDRDLGRKSPRRVTGVRQRDILNLPGDFVIESWNPALSAYVDALRFCDSEFGVPDGTSKPSDAMILTLAYQLARQNDSDSRELITKWYWQSVVDQRYAQGANTQILTDLNQWPAIKDDWVSLGSLLSGNLLDPAKRNRILRLGVRGLLVKRGARDPITGETLAGALEELPIGDLLGMEDDAPGKSDPPTVDYVLLNPGSLQEWRREGGPLALEAMASQGFVSINEAASLGDVRSERVRELTNWFRGLA